MKAAVIVINLDRDTERLAFMREQFERLRVGYERFSALRGDDLPEAMHPYFPPGTPLTPGEIGCYASHLAIMQRVASGALPSPMLVLEDDVALPHDIARTIERLLETLPTAWDIVRLSYPSKRVMQNVAPLGVADLVRYTHVPVSTGGYLISRAGARKFLAPRPRDLPIDQDLRRVWAWRLSTYGVSPPPIRADAFGESSIDAIASRCADAKRKSDERRLRRARETLWRFAHGMREFGAARWLSAEAVNVAARLTPKHARGALLEWAKARLA